MLIPQRHKRLRVVPLPRPGLLEKAAEHQQVTNSLALAKQSLGYFNTELSPIPLHHNSFLGHLTSSLPKPTTLLYPFASSLSTSPKRAYPYRISPPLTSLSNNLSQQPTRLHRYQLATMPHRVTNDPPSLPIVLPDAWPVGMPRDVNTLGHRSGWKCILAPNCDILNGIGREQCTRQSCPGTKQNLPLNAYCNKWLHFEGDPSITTQTWPAFRNSMQSDYINRRGLFRCFPVPAAPAQGIVVTTRTTTTTTPRAPPVSPASAGSPSSGNGTNGATVRRRPNGVNGVNGARSNSNDAWRNTNGNRR